MDGFGGSGLLETAMAADVALQLLASVVVTLYEPGVETVIDCVVAPFDQRYEAAALEVSVTEPPAQNVVGPDGVMEVVGTAFRVVGPDGDLEVLGEPFEE